MMLLVEARTAPRCGARAGGKPARFARTVFGAAFGSAAAVLGDAGHAIALAEAVPYEIIWSRQYRDCSV